MVKQGSYLLTTNGGSFMDEDGGRLDIIYRPVGLPKPGELNPVHEIINDINESIRNGELILKLEGFSRITFQKRIHLEGTVSLSSSHLFDPIIINSSLKLVSIKASSYFKHCEMSSVGYPHWGDLTFLYCDFGQSPKGLRPGFAQTFKMNNLI